MIDIVRQLRQPPLLFLLFLFAVLPSFSSAFSEGDIYLLLIKKTENHMLLHDLIQGCKTKIGLRNILCSIQKEQKGWWKRLLKSEEKPAPYIKVDWNKWCDEDDEESDGEFVLQSHWCLRFSCILNSFATKNFLRMPSYTNSRISSFR